MGAGAMRKSYQHLQADRVIITLERLQARIVARFPEAGLAQVCAELIGAARFSAKFQSEATTPPAPNHIEVANSTKPAKDEA